MFTRGKFSDVPDITRNVLAPKNVGNVPRVNVSQVVEKAEIEDF